MLTGDCVDLRGLEGCRFGVVGLFFFLAGCALCADEPTRQQRVGPDSVVGVGPLSVVGDDCVGVCGVGTGGKTIGVGGGAGVGGACVAVADVDGGSVSTASI